MPDSRDPDDPLGGPVDDAVAMRRSARSTAVEAASAVRRLARREHTRDERRQVADVVDGVAHRLRVSEWLHDHRRGDPAVDPVAGIHAAIAAAMQPGPVTDLAPHRMNDLVAQLDAFAEQLHRPGE